ncbi:hypothetical protein H5410_002459, partial [Solanum commersonii]
MTEDNKLNTIMQEDAAFKLKHGRKEEAARLYEQLVKSHGSIEALVGLIQTAAHADIEKAEAYEKQLKPLLGLKAIDVDSLEKTSGAKQAEKGPIAANPGSPPDPERWLPKRERSSYRPKRKDKRATQIRDSQSAVAKEAASSSDMKSNQLANLKGASQNAVQSKASSKSRNANIRRIKARLIEDVPKLQRLAVKK